MTIRPTVAIRSLGMAMMLLSGLACVVTPEPIPLNEAGGGFDSAILLGDASAADLMEGLDIMPPGGDAVPPPDISMAPLDAHPDLTMEGGPTEVGPPEAGGEGGPQEAGPGEAGPEDLGRGQTG